MSDYYQRPIVKRVKRVDIRGFRGFCSAKESNLDTDGDIVLITGGNGFGKSSLLQALTLLLTGIPELPSQHIFSHNPEYVSKKHISIKADVEFLENENPHEGQLEVEWPLEAAQPTLSANISQRSPLDWPRSLLGNQNEEGELSEEAFRDAQVLLARTTSFYVENIESLFDSIAKGDILRDIFNAMPVPVRSALEELEKFNEDVSPKRRAVSSHLASNNALSQALSDAAKSLEASWRPLRAALESFTRVAKSGVEPPVRAVLVKLAELNEPNLKNLGELLSGINSGKAELQRDIAKSLVNRFVDIISVQIREAQKRAGKGRGTEDLEAELAGLDERAKTIERVYPKLDEEIEYFRSDTGSACATDLLAVFHAIGMNRDRWLKNILKIPERERERLQFVEEELRFVEPLKAHMRAEELKAWLEPRWKLKAERESLKERRKSIKVELEKLRSSEEVKALKTILESIKDGKRGFEDAYMELWQAERRRELQKELVEVANQLDGLQSDIDDTIETLKAATQGNEQIFEAVSELADKVLSRFSLVEKILPLSIQNREIGKGRVVKTKSGLELAQLSMGQKSQVAVSLAVAQSELLRRAKNVDLPFNLLLLDDVSTAYDLSNITREAILWRQLAYHSKPDQRWQLFISSHHEDLSNHLLDLLVPPEGCRLRVLQFKGWSQESGPEIESFEVEPSREIEGQDRLDIGESLKEVLCQA